MQYTQVRLLEYTPVLLLMLDDGLCSTLDGKCSTPKWSFWCTWLPLQYTWLTSMFWWHHVGLLIYMIGYADYLMTKEIQYTQVRLLKCTPVLFLMLDDGLCSTLDGKCSTPKWGSWSAPQCCYWCYMMAYAVHLMANAVHPSEASDVHDCLCSTLDWLVCFWWHHVRLLIYMIGYADHLMANTVHTSEAPEVHPSVVPDMMACVVHLIANAVYQSEAFDVHDRLCITLDWLVCFWWHHVRLLIYMIGYADHLMTNAAHRNEAPEVHPSVVPDVKWWPLQYTWWQMQYTQVKLLMYMMAYSVHLLAYTVHHVRLLIYMIGYADHLMANAIHPSEVPEVHLSVVPDVRWWPLQYTW